MVVSTANWDWSSARAHLGFGPFTRGLDREFREQSGGVQRWQTLLTEPDPEEWAKRFRRAIYAGNPFGSEEFVERVRQAWNTTETLLTPAAWIREPSPLCYDFLEKVHCDGSIRTLFRRPHFND